MAVIGQVIKAPEDGWKRYDSIDGRFHYTGSWTDSNSVNTYGGSEKRTSQSGATVSFKFYGTKIRLMADMNPGFSDNVTISIDDIVETFSMYNTGDVLQALYYEKNSLTLGVHTITITNNTSKIYGIDSIDIDSDGDLLGTGIVLTSPESGWKRYDDNDSRISYIGNWLTESVSGNYLSTSHINRSTGNPQCIFKFYGTKFRIITAFNNDHTANLEVIIDNMPPIPYSESNTSLIRSVLGFEKVGLDLKVHTVKIQKSKPDSLAWTLDAIDIDNSGDLLSADIALKVPEDGWKRYDDLDSRLSYVGLWQTFNDSFRSGPGVHYTTTPGSYFECKFYGTKFRLISSFDNTEPNDFAIKVTIDDIIYPLINPYHVNNPGISSALMFNVDSLPSGIHHVKIECIVSSGFKLCIDAIDIDDDGDLLGTGIALASPENGWKRYDDTDSRIMYFKGESKKEWTRTTNTIYYNSSYTESNSIGQFMKFRIYSNKLRIIALIYLNCSSKVDVLINGEFHSSFSAYSNDAVVKVVCKEIIFDKFDNYEITLINKEDMYFTFDAIDINSNGDLLGTGITLASPEPGWRRYDDTDSRIRYTGTGWVTSTNTFLYNGNEHASNKLNDKITFKFYGTKLRILSGKFTNNPDNIDINIDGMSYKYNQSGTSTYQAQTVLFEKLGLDLDIHTVIITNPSDTLYIALDAIDIDSNGYLTHPILNQVDDLDNMQIGDCIPCRYTSTSGVAGTFSELGTCDTSVIPTTGTATPDGLFYFIKVDKGTLIADRVVQTNISWDVLNNAKYIEGKNYGTYELNFIKAGGYISVPYNKLLSPTKCISIEVDISMKDWNTTNSYKIISKTQVGGYCLGINTGSITNKLSFYVDVGGKYSIVNVDLSTLSSGYHTIKGIYDGNIVAIYVDEILIDSLIATGNIGYTCNNSLIIGGEATSSTGVASPAEFLTDASIKRIIISGSSTSSTTFNTLADWRFQNNSNILLDSSVNKLHGTINGLGTNLVFNILKSGSIFRSISGGCTYIDSNGNPSLTDKSLGAWPVNNEWDKYIVNSDLDGKIIKGDDNIWNYNEWSWCKETGMSGIITVNTPSGAKNTSRVIRKMAMDAPLSSLSTSIYGGFRPVLNYIESDIANEVIY